jgi:hypothetical protein
VGARVVDRVHVPVRIRDVDRRSADINGVHLPWVKSLA